MSDLWELVGLGVSKSDLLLVHETWGSLKMLLVSHDVQYICDEFHTIEIPIEHLKPGEPKHD